MTIIASHRLRVSAAEAALLTVAVLIGLFFPELWEESADDLVLAGH
jgi:hypothetical protein